MPPNASIALPLTQPPPPLPSSSVSVAAGSALTSAQPLASPSPRIPIATLFRPPSQLDAQLAPDGNWFAFLRETNQRMGIWNVFVQAVPRQTDLLSSRGGVYGAIAAQPTETKLLPPHDQALQITFETRRSIGEFRWSPAPCCHRLFYLLPVDNGDHLHCVDLDLSQGESQGESDSEYKGTRETTQFFQPKRSRGYLVRPQDKDLTPATHARVTNFELHRAFPDKVFVTMNRDPTACFGDFCSIDVVTGRITVEARNPGDIVAWFVDQQFELAACSVLSRHDSSQSLFVLHDEATAPPQHRRWHRIATWPEGEIGEPIMLNEDATGFFVQTTLCHDGTDATTDTSHLVLISTKDGKALQTLAGDEKSDISKVCANSDSHTVDYTVFNHTKPRVEILCEHNRRDLERLTVWCHGVFDLVSRSADDRVWIYTDTCDDRSLKYYVFWRDSKIHTLLLDTRPELNMFQLAPMSSHVIKTSDGEDMVVYMTLPPGAKPDKLPFVLNVHEGPWWRDSWGFNEYHQLFANRGYGCLSVNYRGSLGYGRRWIKMSYKQWGKRMQEDLTDAVLWMIRQGYADKERIAIYGRSYGGYATLFGLAFTPELFCCGVDVAGASNLATVYKSFPTHWCIFRRMWLDRVGNVDKDEQLNRQLSPLFHVDNICRPLLIAQASKDSRVQIRETDHIARELSARNVDVKYLVYMNESHLIVGQANVLDLATRIEAFLAKHLAQNSKSYPAPDYPTAIEIDPRRL